MQTQIHYLVRSRQDGQYLVGRPRREDSPQPPPAYLLLFAEHADALSYLNTHGADIADQFQVESCPATQLRRLMDRWGFAGIGKVTDPLLPTVEFLQRT